MADPLAGDEDEIVTRMRDIETKSPQRAHQEPKTETNRGSSTSPSKSQGPPSPSASKVPVRSPVAASAAAHPPLPPIKTVTNYTDQEMSPRGVSPRRGGGSGQVTPRSSKQTTELSAVDEERRKRREAAIKALESEFDFLAVPDWIHLHPLLGAYLAEGLGTFFFVLTIALVVINNPSIKGRPETNIDAIPIGFMLMSMVFTFGYISGGHFNPAVTFAVMLARKMSILRGLMYIVIQCGSSLGAGIVAMVITGSNDIIVPDVQNDATYIRKGIFAELVYTFALATVVLNVAYSQQKKNFFYGFAIGMTVMAGAAAVGGVSGGAFNPAVATGLQVAVCLTGRCEPLLHFWLYWASPAVGALLAAALFAVMWQPEEEGEEVSEERLKESTA